MDLATMRARVREDLQDTDAANYRWTDDEIDGAIERVVREFSLVYPLQQQDDIATTEGSNELDISSLTKLLKVYSVEFPIGVHPPYYQRFTQYMAALYMEDQGDGNDARVSWGKQHCLDSPWEASTAYILGDYVWPTTFNGYRYVCTTAGTSGASEPTWPPTLGDTVNDGSVVWTCIALASAIPEQHEEIIVLGATGYLATSASAYTVDRATIAGRHATINFGKWGKERLARYEKKLKAITSRVTTRELYTEE